MLIVRSLSWIDAYRRSVAPWGAPPARYPRVCDKPDFVMTGRLSIGEPIGSLLIYNFRNSWRTRRLPRNFIPSMGAVSCRLDRLIEVAAGG